MNITTTLLITFLYLFSCVVCDWKQGRGTFYGNEWWAWNIHEGSCGYWYLCPEEGTGWDIAALPDVHWDYLGSCGRCYEVKCLPSIFKDNFGETLDRSGVCYDPESSVVVSITDTCPCNYASNWYSNQRWCCGDMDHLDLSVWAFEKMADTKWGVIGLQYQQVPCDHQPYKVALEPEQIFDPAPVPDGQVCPKGNFPLRPNWESIQSKYRQLYAAKNMYFANPPSMDNQGEISEVTAKQQFSGSAILIDPRPTSEVLFRDGITTQWKTQVFHTQLDQQRGQGIQGGDSICATIQSGGVFEFNGPKGSLSKKISLEVWVKNDGQGIPDVDVNIGDGDEYCTPVRLSDLYTSGSMDKFKRYDIYLGLFNTPRDQSLLFEKAGVFNGCLQIDANDINTVQIRNNRLFEQTVCMDELKLLG